MTWHARVSPAEVDVPGGEIGDPYPAFSRTTLPGAWSGDLYRRNSPGYAGTLFFTDPFTPMVAGDDRESWRCRPISYSLSPDRMEWTRSLGLEEYSIHQTDGDDILHSVFLPFGSTGSTVFRCQTPNGFVFAIDYLDEVAAGIYFMAYTELTAAPALGTGDIPTLTQKHLFENENGCRGAVLVGAIYYFIEPTSGTYPGGTTRVRFSSYDLGSDTYTQGPIMPAAQYYGVSYASGFLVLCGTEEGQTKGLYSYDDAGNTLTLLVRSDDVPTSLGTALGLYTEASASFDLTVTAIETVDTVSAMVSMYENAGTASTLGTLTYELDQETGIVILAWRIIDPDSDYVSFHAEFSTDGGLGWNPATIDSPDLPEVATLPSPGRAVTATWDTAEAAPFTTVTFKIVLDSPADSVGVATTVEIDLDPEVVVPRTELTDKVNAANREAPLLILEASGGTRVPVGKESKIVISGAGLTVINDWGDNRVQAVVIRSSQAAQVFDTSRFKLATTAEGDVLNLVAVVANPGIYDVILLDREGSMIAKIEEAFEAV